ncbi:MAG: class I SAM-dependent methyltransferase [Cryobacterium sp.]
MTGVNLRDRAVDAVEIMDDADCDPVMLARTYADFRVVNAVVSGWHGIYRRRIRPALSTTRLTTLLDVGCGGGDLSRALVRWAAADGLRLEVTAIDPDARAHAWAASRPAVRGLSFRAALSSELVAEGARFDFVVSNHVLHHLDADQLRGLLADSEALVGAGPNEEGAGTALHADIARSRLAYLGFGAATWPFFRSSFIRADGLTSIRRSFTPAELRRDLPVGWQVLPEHPSRYVLRWPAAPIEPAAPIGHGGADA